MFATLISPAVRLMRRLNLASKFVLVAGAFMLPLLYLLYTVVSDRRAVYEFTAKEVIGSKVTVAYAEVLGPALAWRGNSLAAAAGYPDAAQARDAAAQQVQAALTKFAAFLNAQGDPLGAKPELAKLEQLWSKARDAKHADVHSTWEAAVEVTTAFRDFSEWIANNSNLALDPDADSYALMVAYTSELPRLMDALGRARAVGRYLAKGQVADDAEMFMAMHNADALIDEYLARARGALAGAMAVNPSATKALSLDSLDTVEQKIVPRIDAEFAWGAPAKADGDAWWNTLSAELKRLNELRSASGAAMDALLEAREDRLQRAMWAAVGFAALFVGLGMYLLTGFYSASFRAFAALDRRIDQLARGDLSTPNKLDGSDELVKAGNRLGEAMGDLSLLVLQVRSSAEEISASVQEIAAGNQDLSQRGSQLAAIVEETSASTSTLEETVGVNMASAQEANELVQNAAQVAGKGGAVVEQAVQAMNDITESSKKIGDIIQVIDTIAFQTNILALNAAVEAARAGEQGRGFAVVAGEVRALAQRSAAAAREIKGLIQDSIDTVNDGGTYVNEAGNTMTEMVKAIERVTSLMGDITTQSQSQARQIRELGAAIREVDGTVQQNAALVEETAASTAALADRARSLTESTAQFRFDA
jgi:methyl-accepting chemotaxis protein